VKACRPGNAARILAKIDGEQTGWVIGGELMQIKKRENTAMLERD